MSLFKFFHSNKDDEIDMDKAMDDPRYGVDEEYTKQVTKRLSKSKFFSFGR